MPAVEQFDWQDLLNLAISDSMMESDAAMTQINTAARRIMWNNSMYTEDEAIQAASAQFMRLNGFDVEYNRTTGWKSYPRYNTTKTVTPQQVFTGVVNSNNQVTRRGSLRTLYGSVKEFDGTHHFMQMTRFPVSGGLGTKASYILGSVNGAVSAVSAGIWLGKQISPLLYQANPNFWESIGVTQGAFQPENWAAITNGDDSPFAGLFNFILGIDPETGTAQTYMDQNALAYLAYAMSQNGVFDRGYYNTQNDPYFSLPSGIVPFPSTVGNMFAFQVRTDNQSQGVITSTVVNGTLLYSNVATIFIPASSSPFYVSNRSSYVWPPLYPTSPTTAALSYTYNNKTVYYSYVAIGWGGETVIRNTQNVMPKYVGSVSAMENYANRIAWLSVYGSEYVTTVEGISDQPNATLPDTTNWNDIASTLASLQSQYPDTFADGMEWAVDDPASNSIGDTITYVPVPFPQTQSMLDTQPITDTQTQTTLDVNDLPYTLQQTIASILQQTEPSDTPEIPPLNPPDTGEGDSPIPVPPTGAASALWSVYHPTQAQVNSFGAWLWGSPFLTNIGKLFQNPIEGVISLHKIFAPPVDSGTGNIVVGTLDSGVSSATVNQQYVRVDCGSVRCLEQFANVLDYSPHTSVSLYLPFIGIVPLDTDDVMRSTIHVIYGVDVFTGACLAMVEVSRDSHTINMYQYAGTASVEYPLSNVQHAQLMNGIMGIAGGIGLTIASGGAMSPVVAAGAAASIGGGIANAARSNVGRSGSFSGNSGAMGIKKPYLIIQRPQSKVAQTFRRLSGLPTNKSIKLGSCSDFVRVKHVNVTIAATDTELEEIESLLKAGVLV